MTVGPQDGGTWSSSLGSIAKDESGQYRLTWSDPQPGPADVTITARNNAGMSADDQKTLYVEEPELTKEPVRLPFNRATIGSKYRPETEWKSTQIPPEHYLTEVKFGNEVVFSQRGTQFDTRSLPDDLNVGASTGTIATTVYWLPNGNPNRRVPLVTTDPAVTPIVAAYKLPPVSPSYRPPTYDGQYEFTFTLDGRNWDTEFDEIRAQQVTGINRTEGVSSIDASCQECLDFGFSAPRVTQIDEFQWKLFIEVVDKNKLKQKASEIIGKPFKIDLTLNGKGSTPGTATLTMNVKVGAR